MINIKQYFRTLVDISDDDLDLFISKLNRKVLRRKELHLEIGQKENFLSFVEQGILRFYIPKLDYDFTFGFVFPNSFVSGYDSFITRQLSHYNIQAVTDSVLWQISYDGLNDIYDNTKVGERIGRKIAEQLYIKKMNRELSLLQDTAQKRYENLFEEQPELIKTIPLKYIASYIGIRPQSLSRIRRQIK